MLLAALGAGSASADVITLRVENERGVALAGVAVFKNEKWLTRTDGHGKAFISGRSGESYRLSQRDSSTPSSCKLPADQTITLSDPLPEEELIVMDTMVGDAYFEQASGNERDFVGLVNEKRARQGVAPVRISTALQASAQFAAGNSQECFFPHSTLGAYDAGYAAGNNSVGEFGDPALTPKQFFDKLMEQSDLLVQEKHAGIGVAQVGKHWAVTLGLPCQAASCQLTEDVGQPPAAGGTGGEEQPPSGGPGGTSDDPSGSKQARLRLKKVQLKRSRVKLVFKLKKRARGQLKVTLKHGAQRVKRSDARGRTRAIRVKLSDGRWILKAQFEGRRGWRSEQERFRLKLKNGDWQLKEL